MSSGRKPRTFDATRSGRCPERHDNMRIASYVSDDLNLVIRGKLLGLSDDLLDHLWRAYDRGEFPGPMTHP